MAGSHHLRIPVWCVDPRFDKDAPWFPRSLASPTTYLLQALCYDSLAAPTPRDDFNGISSPNFGVFRASSASRTFARTVTRVTIESRER